MNNITIAQDNRNIKRALVKAFPEYKISVTNGSGTAYGWKHINIDTDIPERLNECGRYAYNEEEKEQFEAIEKKANEIIYSVGKKIYHYCADDGYNTERSEVLLQVRGKTD